MAATVSDQEEVRAEINVTPLVDVVLVLLVILMLVAPMLKEDVPVELPIAAHAEEETASEIPVLAIAADGAVTLDGAPLASDGLAARIGAIYATRADKTVMLAADRSLGYARVVEVMDACRAAGIARIGIVTSPEPPSTVKGHNN